MITYPAIFTLAFVTGLSGAMMPGPMLTATIGESLRRGGWMGPAVVLGHGLIEGSVVVALVLGLGPWLQSPTLFMIIALLGGLMLIGMGVQMLRSAKTAAGAMEAERQEGHPLLKGPVLAGVLTSASNPYFYLWWATIGLGLLTQARPRGVPGLLVFYTGHILSDLAWFGLVALAVARGRRVLPPRVFQYLFAGCGLVLIVLGGGFVLSGLKALLQS